MEEQLAPTNIPLWLIIPTLGHSETEGQINGGVPPQNTTHQPGLVAHEVNMANTAEKPPVPEGGVGLLSGVRVAYAGEVGSRAEKQSAPQAFSSLLANELAKPIPKPKPPPGLPPHSPPTAHKRTRKPRKSSSHLISKSKRAAGVDTGTMSPGTVSRQGESAQASRQQNILLCNAAMEAELTDVQSLASGKVTELKSVQEVNCNSSTNCERAPAAGGRWKGARRKPACKGEVIQCDLCNATFNRNSNYRRHRLIHVINSKEDFGYKCDQCSRSFLQRCDLKRHLQVHSGTEPYRCTLCNNGYIRKSDLQVHMKFHSKEKAFQCAHCDKAYYQSGDLRRHVEGTHSDGKVLTCGHCLKKFTSESSLLRHMQSVHGDIVLHQASNLMSSPTDDLPSQMQMPTTIIGTDLPLLETPVGESAHYT